jgi:hypothetical protein
MDRIIEVIPRPRIPRIVPPLRELDLVDELDALRRELIRHAEGYCTKTLIRDLDLSRELFAIKGGVRMREGRARSGASIQVLTGHLALHVGNHCGDDWDMLPYYIRNTEGACSFFALDDDMIDLPIGTVLVLDPTLPPDLEALDDSAFLLDVTSPA